MDFGGGRNLPNMMGMDPEMLEMQRIIGMNPELMRMGDMMPGMGMGGMGMPGMMTGMQGMGMSGPMGMGPLGRPNPPPPPMPPQVDPIKPGNIYWKTRMCNKWLQGQCPTPAPMCNYAHGRQELRFVTPEMVKQAEQAKQRQEGGAGPGPPDRPPPPSQPPPPHLQGPGGGVPQAVGGDEVRGGRQLKTRLCHEFMQKGSCHKGSVCKYAHGPQELRSVGGGGRGPAGLMQEGASGVVPPPPGGPMFKPPPPAGPPPPGPGMPPPQRGRDAMPSPRGDHQELLQPHPREQAGGAGGQADAGLQLTPPSEVPLLERVRAMCTLLGVGDAALDPHPSAVQAAVVSVRNGSAFAESAYADSIESFMR